MTYFPLYQTTCFFIPLVAPCKPLLSSGDYKITKGDYYSVKGAHSVFQDDIIETTTTCTDAIPIN